MYYNLDRLLVFIFPRIWRVLPSALRFARVLLYGLAYTNEALAATTDDYAARAKTSPQRLSLEISLNDRFDPELRRITVGAPDLAALGFVFNVAEGVVSQSLEAFIFNSDETIPEGAPKGYYFNSGESAEGAGSSDITAPTALASLEPQIRAWVDAVLLFSHTYNLIFV